MEEKSVPSYCVANGRKYYQFTAKDERTRWTYREMYEEHSTHSAWKFLLNPVRKAFFPVRMIQTDNDYGVYKRAAGDQVKAQDAV